MVGVVPLGEGRGGNYSWGSGILRDASLPLPSCLILVNDEEAICDTVLDHAVLHNNHQTYALELLAKQSCSGIFNFSLVVIQ